MNCRTARTPTSPSARCLGRSKNATRICEPWQRSTGRRYAWAATVHPRHPPRPRLVAVHVAVRMDQSQATPMALATIFLSMFVSCTLRKLYSPYSITPNGLSLGVMEYGEYGQSDHYRTPTHAEKARQRWLAADRNHRYWWCGACSSPLFLLAGLAPLPSHLVLHSVV